MAKRCAAPYPRERHKAFIYWPFISPRKGSSLEQVEVGVKENEISAAAGVLATVPLKNRVVCADAMQTQRKLSVEILAKGEIISGQLRKISPPCAPILRNSFSHLVSLKDGIFRNCLVGKRKRLTKDMKEPHLSLRTSVGNNLSDISRRNPELVFQLVDELVAMKDKNAYWIATRACRNLVKEYPIRVMDALEIDEYKYKNRIHKRSDYSDNITHR